ncbi:p21-C-terminal region-binding protein-domain-containing protein [Hyaloraphidium curvatum]|nr:p21-C-terminal region-binding protein-domain-containing protein [Hyaloraphidium curvatum]
MASDDEVSESSSGSDSGSDDSMVNVDFDFRDLEEIDFHGLKNLLRQLIPVHEDGTLDASDVADGIISRTPAVGSTVKVADDEGGDPYAVLTVVPLTGAGSDKEGIRTLRAYLERRGGERVKSLLKAGKPVAFVFNERLINMPAQVAPKLFELLLEELATARDEAGQAWNFEHFVYLSKTYREVESTVIDERDEAQPKQKAAKGKPAKATFYFHAEDEQLVARASYEKDFDLPQDPTTSDGRRVFDEFGIEPRRKLLVLDKQAFEQAAEAIVKLAAEM